MRCVRGVLMCLALAAPVVVGCGGGDGEIAGTSAQSEVDLEQYVGVEMWAVAEALVAELGPAVAPTAVAFALDRGYSAAQIAGAALRADGTIDGVEPEFALAGVFSDLPPIVDGVAASAGESVVGESIGGRRSSKSARRFVASADEQVTADEWVRGVAGEFLIFMAGPSSPAEVPADEQAEVQADGDRAGIVMIALVLGLADAGYSTEQIVHGIVFDEFELGLILEVPLSCWYLRNSDGRIIRPARPAGDAFVQTQLCWDLLPQFDELEQADQIDQVDEVGDVEQVEQVAPTESDTPLGDQPSMLHGSYRGSIDIAGVYRQIGFVGDHLDLLRVWDNEVVAEFADGGLVSLSGSARSSYPEQLRDDGGTCGQDAYWEVIGDPAEFAATAEGFEVPVRWRQQWTSVCTGWSDREEENDNLVLGVGRLESDGTIRFALLVEDDWSLELFVLARE